jgi:hypothetical protein
MARVARLTTLLALLAFLGAFSASATIVINFDTDASGNPIAAPSLSIETTRLDELYAPLGVHFWGPTVLTGTMAEPFLIRTVTLELMRTAEEMF